MPKELWQFMPDRSLPCQVCVSPVPVRYSPQIPEPDGIVPTQNSPEKFQKHLPSFLTFGFGFPATLHVNVTGIPSKILQCFSFISKYGDILLSIGSSPCCTSSSDSSTGDLSSLYSISLINLCSKLETLYSCQTRGRYQCPASTHCSGRYVLNVWIFLFD